MSTTEPTPTPELPTTEARSEPAPRTLTRERTVTVPAVGVSSALLALVALIAVAALILSAIALGHSGNERQRFGGFPDNGARFFKQQGGMKGGMQVPNGQGLPQLAPGGGMKGQQQGGMQGNGMQGNGMQGNGMQGNMQGGQVAPVAPPAPGSNG